MNIERLVLARMVCHNEGHGLMIIRVPLGFDWLASELSCDWEPVARGKWLFVPVEPAVARAVRDVTTLPESDVSWRRHPVKQTLSVVASLGLHTGQPLSITEMDWLVALVGDGPWCRGVSIKGVYIRG